jgi:hypothetical protein
VIVADAPDLLDVEEIGRTVLQEDHSGMLSSAADDQGVSFAAAWFFGTTIPPAV